MLTGTPGSHARVPGFKALLFLWLFSDNVYPGGNRGGVSPWFPSSHVGHLELSFWVITGFCRVNHRWGSHSFCLFLKLKNARVVVVCCIKVYTLCYALCLIPLKFFLFHYRGYFHQIVELFDFLSVTGVRSGRIRNSVPRFLVLSLLVLYSSWFMNFCAVTVFFVCELASVF